MLKEFRDFAIKGNMLDMAVGIIIGAAFGTIVSSLVQDILTPPLGLVLGGVDFSDLFVTLKHGNPAGPYVSLDAAKAAGAVTLNIGLFINALIKFVIVAFALFMVVKGANQMRRLAEREKAAAPPPAPTEDVVLLREIRDLMAEEAKAKPRG
ncbi:large conductance mechanosensitive channel protein MscL [Segnochrobactrum spirostomi]|uniref:Large-conductance mechanosensitive channel n=1 Tax=Segnochrobactrum spirostomi TaxID=2608987 RepID=A0A6A7Y3S5_9HYPH|nr:large conductance mechanosensitive channel protein MscL [Segnochrobactrum spirostomi]MQT13780.1 large conductance mechanosensitive channel protein MscL [Segnochrobactrum spirostomi]